MRKIGRITSVFVVISCYVAISCLFCVESIATNEQTEKWEKQRGPVLFFRKVGFYSALNRYFAGSMENNSSGKIKGSGTNGTVICKFFI